MLFIITLFFVIARREDAQPQQIAYVSNNHVYVMDADGNNIRLIHDGAGSQAAPRWSSDGAWITYVAHTFPTINILRASNHGNRVEMLSKYRETAYRTSTPIWSPNGDSIAYVYSFTNRGDGKNNASTTHLALINLNDYSQRLLSSSARVTLHPQWSPDGQWIAYVANPEGDLALYRVRVDGSDIQRLTPHGMDVDFPIWSPDSRSILYIEQSTKQLIRTDADGNNPILLTPDGLLVVTTASWSADGKQIVFAVDVNGIASDIFTVRADGSELNRIVLATGVDTEPHWSSDGGWILFVSNRFGRYQIYKMRPDGSDVQQLTSHPAGARSPSWSPIINFQWRPLILIAIGFSVLLMTILKDFGKNLQLSFNNTV